ncbi:MAG: hypothetical protein GIW94_07500 [Candidatus Eremiobacteraeota bacterium]|nr:hypothetical protein [Candidatus Eremiobacteraeota bacterium]
MRRLGRTEARVSLIGMGGFHIGHPDQPDAEAIKLIHAAIERGINVHGQFVGLQQRQ